MDSAPFKLTPRELDVAKLLLLGSSNKQIARQMAVEVRTSKGYVSSMLRKTVADNRTAQRERLERAL